MTEMNAEDIKTETVVDPPMETEESHSNSNEGNANLYITGLPRTWNEAQLKSSFGMYGTVAQCRVLLDSNTGLSRGQALVRYAEPASAAEAIKVFNGHTLPGSVAPLVVVYSDSDEEKARKRKLREQLLSNMPEEPTSTPGNNIYIKGLPKSWTTEHLESTFAHYGTIKETKLLLDRITGLSRGEAFVRYNTQEEAAHAISLLNNYTIPETTDVLSIKYADSEVERMQRRQRNSARQQQRGPGRFSPYGGHNQGGYGGPPYGGGPGGFGGPNNGGGYGGGHPGGPGGYGGHQGGGYGGPGGFGGGPGGYGGGFGDRGGRGNQMTPGADPTNLFVKNLPPEADEASLYKLFGPFGAISSVKIFTEPENGLCRGIGFVRMVNLPDAYSAIQGVTGQQLGGKSLHVSFKR